MAAMAVPLIGAVNSNHVSTNDSRAGLAPAVESTPAHKETTALLKQVAANARTAGDHAETLESFARGKQVSVETHAYELTRARGVVNTMGADLARLQELHAEALPWQQMVINQLQPMLSDLADHTTDAIEGLNARPRLLHQDDYRDAIAGMSDRADQVTNLISVNVDYAKAAERLNRLDAA
jgi:hypothetical protein